MNTNESRIMRPARMEKLAVTIRESRMFWSHSLKS